MIEELTCQITMVLTIIDWAVVPDWISAIATFCLAYIALRGVRAWQKEHRGKSRFNASRDILKIVHQLQGYLWLEPVAYKGAERLEPETFVELYPNEFIKTVKNQAKQKWMDIEPLISELYAEGVGSKALLGEGISEDIRILISSFKTLDPNRISKYKPSSGEMGGEEISVEQFAEKVLNNSILNLPEKITNLEKQLSKLFT